MCFALLAATVFAYFGFDKPVVYDIKVALEGALPMMSGDDKKAEVSMTFRLSGAPVASDGSLRSRFVLEKFSVGLMNSSSGAYEPLPLNRDSAKAYFPDSTANHTSQGKLGAIEPKAKPSPFRLPGVDTESLPALTFFAMQFPEGDMTADRTWTYTRTLLGAPTTYNAKYLGKDEVGEKFELTLKQETSGAEGKSRVEGHGFVWMDRPVGKIVRGDLMASVISYVPARAGKPPKDKIVKMKVSLRAEVE